MASIISAGTTSGTALNMSGDTTGNLVFNTGGANTTALTISATQAATFSNNVSITGNLTLTNALPVAQGGTGGTTANAAAANLGIVGVGQTTQNVTATRVLGTTYTNSTGKPIVVYCCMSNVVGSALVISSIDGETIFGTAVAAAGGNYYGITLVVPNGSTYTNNMNGTPVLQLWIETR